MCQIARSFDHALRPLGRLLALCLWALLFSSPLSAATADPSYKPPRGFVPDERTAIAIAEAVLVPIYGTDQIARERPFHAKLEGNVWTVRGSMPQGWAGGVAVVQIDKSDGRILQVMHGK